MKKIIFILLSLYSLNSCYRNAPLAENVINVDLDHKNNVSIFHFFKSIDLIPLETKDEALIANIRTILQHDSIIYILDDRQGVIFLFNNKGRFVNKINRKGRGPGEYSFIYDMKLNLYNQTLEVLNPMGELLVFSLSGEYIQNLRLQNPPTAYNEFSIINRDSILFYSIQENHSLYLYSRKQNKIIADYYEENKEFATYKPMKSLFQYNDTTYFCRGVSSTVYKFAEGKVEPNYEWHFGKYRFEPQEYISSNKPKSIETVMRESKSLPYVHGYNLQNEEYLFTSILKDEKIISVFFNKKSNEVVSFYKTIENVLFMPHLFTDSTALVKIEPGFTIRDFVCPDMLDSKGTAIINQLSEDSNPVLIRYNFK